MKCSCPSLSGICFIGQNITGFSATNWGNNCEITWISQRNKTQQLSLFVCSRFRQTCKVFLNPVYMFCTLNNDLYVRAKDNQVKSLSARRADREWYTADAIASSPFRTTLMVRFRRREEKQTQNVQHLIECALEGLDEQSLHGILLTANRGYRNISLICSFLPHSIGSIFIMPGHILGCYPFLGNSFMTFGTDDSLNRMRAVRN